MPHQFKKTKDNLFFIAVGMTMSLLNAVYKNEDCDFPLLKLVHMTSPSQNHGKSFDFSSGEDQYLELKTLYEQYL